MRRAILISLLVTCGVAVAAVTARRRFVDSHTGIVELQDAWSRVRGDPRNPVAWGALGDAQAAIDQLTAAEESYQTAVRLGSEDPSLLGRLGFLLYGQGRDEEALVLLELRERPRAAPAGDTAGEGADSTAPANGCDSAAPAEGVQPRADPAETRKPRATAQAAPVSEPLPDRPAACALPLVRSGQLGTLLADVELDGEPVRLVVDTGASITVVNRDTLDQLGVPVVYEDQLHAFTAAGRATFPTAVVPSLSVAGRTIRSLRVAVCEQCGGKGVDGLMGLDVQAALGLELNLRAGRLRLLDCEEQP